MPTGAQPVRSALDRAGVRVTGATRGGGGLLRKVLAGGDGRTSRFHTEDNVFIGWPRLLTQTPIVVGQKIGNTIAGQRPVVPWWPRKAIAAVESRLTPDMVAVEFGSGSSTIWIARRVKSVLAREHDAKWAAITRERIAAEGLASCTIEHRSGADYYAFEPDTRFDFAVVDGEYRWKCIEALSSRMNPGGLIYFDNSDSDKDAGSYAAHGVSGTHHAQRVIAELEQAGTVRVEPVHDMIDGELFAGSGLLVHFDRATAG